MRRLARHALNALTALSLLLCVATVVLWGFTYRYRGELIWMQWNERASPRNTREARAGSSSGSLWIAWEQFVWSDAARAKSVRAENDVDGSPLQLIWRRSNYVNRFYGLTDFAWAARDR